MFREGETGEGERWGRVVGPSSVGYLKCCLWEHRCPNLHKGSTWHCCLWLSQPVQSNSPDSVTSEVPVLWFHAAELTVWHRGRLLLWNSVQLQMSNDEVMPIHACLLHLWMEKRRKTSIPVEFVIRVSKVFYRPHLSHCWVNFFFFDILRSSQKERDFMPLKSQGKKLLSTNLRYL